MPELHTQDVAIDWHVSAVQLLLQHFPPHLQGVASLQMLSIQAAQQKWTRTGSMLMSAGLTLVLRPVSSLCIRLLLFAQAAEPLTTLGPAVGQHSLLYACEDPSMAAFVLLLGIGAEGGSWH